MRMRRPEELATDRLRLRPRDGAPGCYVEWISQTLIKIAANAAVFAAIFSALTFYVAVFGVPFVEGR